MTVPAQPRRLLGISRSDAALALCLAAITLVAFAGVARNGFVNFDDDTYLTANPAVQEGLSLRGLAWAFTTTHAVNWHPLTWISHMLDVSLFGLRSGAHHLVGLALHAANALLLFSALRLLTGAALRSALVAALFAVHPLHVESVAWAAERKDLLATCFTLLALLAWQAHLRRPAAARFAGACALYALALLAKPMPVTFPFVLLLLDWWPLGRWARDTRRPTARANLSRVLPPAALWREKAPLFALAAAASVVTFVVQRGAGAMTLGEQLGLPARLANAALSWVRYLGKTAWPQGLALVYPLPHAIPPWWLWAGALLVLAAVTIVAVRLRGTRPWLCVGWLWYLGTLVPVIGLVQVGAQSLADRYTYLPLVGVFVAASWGLAELVGRRGRLLGASAVAVLALLGALAAAARAQTAVWRDAETLFRHALAVTERNGVVQHHLANSLAAAGRDEEAVVHYRETLALFRFHAPTYGNLGGSYARLGRVNDAERNFRTALAIDPGYGPAHYNLGVLLAREGREAEAAACFAQALRLDPGHRAARDNLERFGRGGEGGAP